MTKKTIIMEKALELFALEGYENTGVQTIVLAAEVTKPTLYHYFGSKDGLLESIYESYFNPLIYQLKETLPYNQDTVLSIESTMGIYLKTAKKHTMFFWLLSHLRKSPLNSPSRLVTKHYYEKEMAFITDLMTHVCNHHSHLKGQEHFLSVTLLSLIHGYIETVILNNENTEITEDMVHRLAKQFLYGIYAL